MTASINAPAGATVFAFSSIAHFFVHLCVAFNFTIVLLARATACLPGDVKVTR